jgi:hypothetical protein
MSRRRRSVTLSIDGAPYPPDMHPSVWAGNILILVKALSGHSFTGHKMYEQQLTEALAPRQDGRGSEVDHGPVYGDGWRAWTSRGAPGHVESDARLGHVYGHDAPPRGHHPHDPHHHYYGHKM